MAEVISPDTPVSKLECKVAFENLTDKEKLYAHYLSRASFEGGLIVLLQTSPESVPIFLLLQALFSGQPLQELKTVSSCNEDEWKVLKSAIRMCKVSANVRGFFSFLYALVKKIIFMALSHLSPSTCRVSPASM